MNIKQYFIVLITLCASFMGFGQVKIAELTFESAGGYTTSVGEFTDNATDYFIRTDGSNITNETFNNIQGSFYFAAQDTDGDGGPASLTLDFSNINISGYTNLEIRVHLAEDAAADGNEDWDVGSYVHFNGTIDGGPSENLIWIENDGSTFNSAPFIDTNYDGDGDGSEITSAFTQFTNNITGTGNLLNLQIEINYLDDGDEDIAIDNIEIWGIATCTDTLDFYNLQSPEKDSRTVGSAFNVYAKTYEAGVTNDGDFPDDAGTGIEVWIGYNTVNNDPSTAGWSWIPASFNTQIVNDDEFVADIGSALQSGTYYYASRFRLNGCGYTYGGFDIGGGDGVWDGVNDINGVLTVDQVDWCNLQFPEMGSIVSGGIFDVYARVNEPGVTDVSNIAAGVGIECWIGYSAIDATVGNSINNTTTRADFASSDWTWVSAGYNQDYGNDDEFFVDIGSCIPPGTYVYASRFRLNGGAYSYGGVIPPNGGNFWDGTTYISGTLTVTNPPTANVVITEIMYNSSGTDDEWIEICNVSGSTQDISNYSIKTGVFPTETTLFTFPCGTTIANGTCKTVSLGSNGDGTFNNGNGTPASGYCPFTPDFGIGANTNDPGHLTNTTGTTITLYAANGTDKADQVAYAVSDGGDGNGSSLHVIDATQDNSDTGTNWQEVAYGGSWGINSLIPKCVPMVAEIRVDGNLGTFPNIPDDDAGINTPIGTNNTLFAAQFVGSTQSKSYRIQNLGGLDLNLTSVSLIGADPGEFNISINPTSPIIYGTPSILEITFSPNTPGIKNAIVEIINNDDSTDGDTEDVYTFNIRGEGKCVGVIDMISPTSGPEGTIVTVSASGIDLNSATASFNGVPATTVNYISATDMLEVTVPNGASDGNLELFDGSGCTGIIAFDVIDTKISSCGGVGSLSDLIISEITDATTGGETYIEIYNGTGSDVSLNGYSIEIFSNGGTSSNSVVLNNVMLLNDDTYVVAIGVSSSPVTTDPGANTCPIVGGNGELADQTSTVGGINKVDNQHDMIRLVNSGSTVDEFGVYQDNDWMDSTIVTGNRGFNFRRLNTASPLPNPTFNINDWNVIDWVGQGLTSCSTNDYSDIGVFDFSTGTPPTVSSGPTITSSCNTATINVTGTEGSDPAGLAYQWYYNIPGTIGWVEILNTNTDYTGQQGALLTALDTSLLEGYQYYCQIREDDADCYTASDAVQLTLPTTTWDGTSWSSPPTIDKIAILEDDYTTAVGTNGETSFSSCSLIINDGVTLTISDVKNGGVNTYVEVKNDLIVQGTGAIIVHPQAAFVQINNNGQVTADNPDNIQVNKETAPMNNWYEYTYWSSPVEDETISDGLADASPNRRFWFNAHNYKDSEKENGNSGTYSAGQDDIDDDAPWDWQTASGIMQAGVGYASTHNSSIFIGPGSLPYRFIYSFRGLFNNGIIEVPIYRNDDELNDNNWNFLGNPYPSAISADSLLLNNLAIQKNVSYKPAKSGFVEGAIFFWSQNTAPSTTNSGNENKNFSQDDYAIISMTGVIAGGDGITPTRFIPSGQGFFIAFDDEATPDSVSGNIATGTVTFTNSMRVKGTTDNSQFFRTNGGGSNKSKKLDNKLWVNLTSDNGVFNQIAVGYVDYATNAYDGMGYDTPRNLSNPLYSSIYTLISGHDKKFAIQGKDPNSLNLDEVIPLGFDTTINEATFYTLSIENVEGDFLTSNTMYLKDNLLHKVHDLTASDYSFTSEVGEFKDRFEIVFQSESLSDIEAQLNINKLTIIELNDGRVQLKTNSIHTIKSVQILDLLGRTLYQLKGTSTSEIYNLNTLSQAAYIAKVELSNGQIITKKAIKRN